MGELGDILGEDFEEEYNSTREQRREQARRVDTETMMEICYEAIEGGGFEGDEPRFRFDAGEIDHDVLLMESPNKDLQKFRHDLGENAMSMGMFHLDQLFSCAFNEEMLDVLDKIQQETFYVVAGRYEEKTEVEGGGNKKTYYNISPVRGILPLDKAKEYAEKFEEAMEGKSVEEQSKQQQTDDSSSSGDSEKEAVIKVFKEAGNKSPKVLEQVADGHEETIDKLVDVTQTNVDFDIGRERILDIFENGVGEIDGRGEDEDDSPDLSGLVDDDGSSDKDSSDTSSDGGSDSSSTDADEDESDNSTDVSDWF